MELTLAVFLSAICTAVGYKMSACNTNGRLDVKETSEQILTCTDITDDYMFWDFTPSGGTTIQIAACTWSKPRCNITDSDYAVTRPQYGTSTLTVRRNHRTKISGVVRCGGAFNVTVTLPAECRVRVVYPAKQVTSCRTEVNRTDWTVSGSCDVDKSYASDNQYTCRWFHVPPSGQQTSFYGVMAMSSFTDNGLEYLRGRCSFSGQSMPTTDGDHVYNLRIDPGQSRDGNKLFAGPRLTIQHPVDPVLSNCPPFVIEGDDVNCSCQTSGSPPAVVTWVVGGTTDSKILVLRNVSRSLDGHNFTCSQFWGGVNRNWRTTTYSIQVHSKSGDSTAPGTTTSTTVFSLYTAKSGDSTAPGTTTSATGATSQTSTEGASSDNVNGNNINNNDCAQQVALVGAVGGVAIVIIVALVFVIVVIWKRRCNPVYTKPTSRGQDDASPYTELSDYEHVDCQTSGTAQYENSGMQQQEAKEQAQYENTDTERQPSPYEVKYENTTTQRDPAPPDRHYENSVKTIDE